MRKRVRKRENRLNYANIASLDKEKGKKKSDKNSFSLTPPTLTITLPPSPHSPRKPKPVINDSTKSGLKGLSCW